EGKIRFEVRDTGIGIPQDKLQAIFQPFEQVSDAKRQSEGTGLGLAISQEIVELMGSTIQVQSEIGVGSIFWFDVNLPEAAEWVKTAQADRHGQIIGIKNCKPRILVVDDKWENRSVISKLLSPIGFDVVEAATGQEGWQRAVEFQPDLMITDLMMPHMDGFELIKQIRGSETLKDKIIIVSSASVFETDQYRSIEAGGDDFLPKPVLAAELLQKLQKHLQLEWLYEEQQSSISPVMDKAELIAPPASELETLYELAMKGSFKGILKQAALLEQMDQKYSPFAKKLHQLAKGFQDQEILALIQSYR
ncbi:response regulator, partial [Leptolyngbya sp. FACHB-711]